MPEATLELDIRADLAQSREDAERHHKWIKDRFGEPIPVEDRVLPYGVSVGTLPLLVRMEGPPAGKMYVGNWVAFFPDGEIALPTSVWCHLCVGPTPSLSFGNLQVVAPYVLPGYTSLRKVFCRGNQQFYAVIFGTGSLTGAGQVNVNVGVDVWPDTSAARFNL